MSNIIFDSGNYIKQCNLGNTQDGLIYLDTENRNIAIGTTNEFINFNDLLVNYNKTLDNLENYTYTSQFINDNIMKLGSSEYYSVAQAINVIGNTDDNISNGYIKNKLLQLINGITYEGIIDENYTVDTVTRNNVINTIYTYNVEYPDIINKNFNIVIAFIYTPYSDQHSDVTATIQTNIYPVFHQNDMQISIETSYYAERPIIYKAFWV